MGTRAEPPVEPPSETAMDVSAEPGFRCEAVPDALRAAFEEALATGDLRRDLALHLPIAVLAPERLWRASPVRPAVLFGAPDEGPTFAGVGAAVTLRGREPETLRREAAERFDGLDERTLARTAAPRARFFGGIPFDGPRTLSAGFASGAFVLPRWRLARDGKSGWLTLVALAKERRDPAFCRERARELTRLATALATPADPTPAPRCVAVDDGDPQRWLALVAHALREIAAARLEKVVLARPVEVEMAAAPEPLDVLEALAREAGWGARLALGDFDETFVAVSPERLVRRRGLEIECDALAGTCAAGAGDVLATSEKDAREHALVVRAIEATLSSFGARSSAPTSPGRRVLRHVTHLHTPVRAALERPHHVLALVARLAPTPAVGGTPRAEALRFIADHEGAPRGLFAGVVGWFDSAGDGDFWVGLRSGVLRGRRAVAWAGAGIVAGSEPWAELRETRLKQRAFLRALGAEP